MRGFLSASGGLGMKTLFLSLPHGFTEQVLDLAVDRTEIILGPLGNLVPQGRGKALSQNG